MKPSLPRLICILTAVLLCLAGCKEESKPQAKALKSFQILLDWQSEPTYLGVYYAKEKGYFRELGLDVEIVPSWGANQAVSAVASGKYSICTASGGATVLGYNSGAKIVSLAVLYPQIPSVVYGLAATNVQSPQDLVGKKIGIYPGSITANEFDAFLKANHLTKDQINIVSLTGADIPLLLGGQIDAVLHYYEMSPVTVELNSQLPQTNGKRTFCLRLSEHGVPGYGLNIVTSREALAKDGGLVRQVAAAMVRGYEEARKNPEDAAAAFARVFPEKDKTYIKDSLARVNTMLGTPLGAQDAAGWKTTIDLYDSLGLLKMKPTPEDVLP